MLYITESRFLRNGTNGPRTEYIFTSENFFNKFVSPRLIFTSEVQVDIRFLIPVESQEGFERNIISFPSHGRSAQRTHLFRHVTSAVVTPVLDEFVISLARDPFHGTFLIGTQIVRRKRIYLRDPAHGGRERRSYRSSRTNQIAVGQRFLHQKLRRNVHHGVSVGNNGVQLLQKTGLYQLW